MTPSSVRNVRTIIFLIKSTPYQLLGDGRKAMPPGLSSGSRVHVSATKRMQRFFSTRLHMTNVARFRSIA